ncbi:dTDP-4-dehydrorhamnose reductase [Candidatus Marinimicrobia bacterium]|nr:dTDP-4-dehydrorhamnose reductase [Candidatus Neomarinimicrobiota bacterium]
MKKILITGGSGQLAQSFKFLFKHEYDLAVLDKKIFDITDPKIVEKTLQQEKPDIVINCAAMTDVDGCENDSERAYLINGLAIENFARSFDGLFIQISTDYVFDGKDGPYLESSETNPVSIYGKSKLLGEEIVKICFKNFLIIRTNVLFDINQNSSFLDWVIRSLSNNQKINVVNDQINNPVWTYDLSKTINFLINNNMNGIFHVGSDILCSRYKFAKIIAEVWDFDIVNIVPISTSDLFKQLDSYVADRPLKSGLITKFEKLPKISLMSALTDLYKEN